MDFLSNINIQDVLLFSAAFLLTKWIVTYHSNGIRRGYYSLPPSPPGLPLIGNLLMIRADMRGTFKRLKNAYGGVFSLRFGPQLVVVTCDIDGMKEAFVTQGDAFSDRAIPALLRYAIGREGSFAFDNGPVWKARRRFGLSAMRRFGMGKTSMERRITEEASILCESFENNQDVDLDPKGLITNAVANVICSISFGFRYEYNDPIFKDLVLNIHRAVSGISFFSIGNLLPILFLTPLYADFRTLVRSITTMVQRLVSDHRKTLDQEHIRDIIDLYILEIKRQRESGKEIVFDEDRAWRAIFDLFAAGTGTTSATLLWAILLMATFPDAMKRVQEEIDRVVGCHRSPLISDQENMPITVATIMEVQRFRPVAPLGVPRVTNQDATIRGYDIPNGTAVFMNLWEVLHSPTYWNEAEEFKPSRFLSEDGKSVTRPEAFIPFGIGNRVCMGELLAKMELFLFFSTLLQRFTFRLADSSLSVGIDGQAGIAFVPHDFSIRVATR